MTNDVEHLFKCILPSVLFSLRLRKRADGSNRKILSEPDSAEGRAREFQDGDLQLLALPYSKISLGLYGWSLKLHNRPA